MEKLYGNAVVGQSGGPTAAINATLSGVIRGALAAIEKGSIGKLYGMRNGIEGFCEERLVDLGKIFTTEQRLRDLERTPAAALGSCRKRLRLTRADTLSGGKKLALGIVIVLVLGGRLAHLRPLPRQLKFLRAGKSLGVFRERKMYMTRLTKQAGISPPMRKTKSGAVSAPKNRVCPCQSRISCKIAVHPHP